MSCAEEALSGEGIDRMAGLEARQTRAKVALALGDVDRAVELYREYEDAAREAGDPRHEALAVGGRGVALITGGDHAGAERALRACARLAERAADLKGQALAWHNLAVVAHLRHDYGAARTRYDEALRLLRLVGNRPSLARVAYNLGELYETLGDPARARSVCELGAHLGGPDVPPRAQAEGLLLRGRIELSERNLGPARAAFEAAATILREVDPIRAAAAAAGLSRVALAEGRPADAERALASVTVPVDPVRAADLAIARAELVTAVEGAHQAVGAWEDAVSRAGEASDESRELAALVGLAESYLAAGLGSRAAAARGRAAVVDEALARRVPEDLAARWDDRPIRRRLLALDLGGDAPRAVAIPAEPAPTLGLVGTSRTMRRVVDLVRRVGPSDCNVLVRGESGTGKELAARALHSTSSRQGGPMVCVNCAAIVDTLLLSELFGHERGAFTGAHERKVGRFEAADGGTLFLDEIGDISPAVQAALLRVLQERRFERVGGHQSIEVDVRVVAATNRDLESMVREGSFREDLYYRLQQVTIEMPPLRERPEDVPALSAHLLTVVAAERGEPARRLSREALSLLMANRWPGNVRQLDNVLRAASLFADGPIIQPRDLSIEGHAALDEALDARARVIVDAVQEAAWVAAPGSEADLCYSRLREGALTLRDLKKEIERECIQRALRESGGNISRAAALLGMKRPRMSQLVKEYGLRPSGSDEVA
jgi:DNA-binding NtrC family response regulator/tetratricopeptide (TPR) repeat protein